MNATTDSHYAAFERTMQRAVIEILMPIGADGNYVPSRDRSPLEEHTVRAVLLAAYNAGVWKPEVTI